MDLLEQLNQTHENKQNSQGTVSYYDQLSLVQKISACQLRQFSFKLKLIRGEMFESMAVFTCRSLSVIVNYLGERDSMTAFYFSKLFTENS
ncbi:hypothetical protein [Colwellia psychrerythraea]|uniref:hypothetical protein n=1 Tax=Colwellia psychrerythraea TaxID=28229 RepID=UPI00051A6C84|nr:hypothetical protein [Colwellia psychrerythraea]